MRNTCTPEACGALCSVVISFGVCELLALDFCAAARYDECGNPISADGYYAGEAYGAGPQYAGKFEAAPSPGYGQYGTAGAPGQYSY